MEPDMYITWPTSQQTFLIPTSSNGMSIKNGGSYGVKDVIHKKWSSWNSHIKNGRRSPGYIYICILCIFSMMNMRFSLTLCFFSRNCFNDKSPATVSSKLPFSVIFLVETGRRFRPRHPELWLGGRTSPSVSARVEASFLWGGEWSERMERFGKIWWNFCWWFQTCFICKPIWGDDPIWVKFSSWLKPRTRTAVGWF